MNELEDLVREELRARVAAAEAAAADEPAPLVAALERRIRRARLRRRWTASALSAVAVAGVIVLPLTLLSPGPAGVNPLFRGPVPLTDTAATPSGWVPVANGNAQISVPADWRVSTRPVCGRAAPGHVVLGSASTSLRVRNPRCRQALNMAAILPLHRPYPAGANPTAANPTVNGILVVWLPAADSFESYVVPSLHVWVTARGPLASRVLATLTRSPLSVVLARGRPFPVSGTWRWLNFGGIRLAVPARWRLEQSSTWGSCFGAFSMDPMTVTLSTALRMFRLSCPFTPDVVLLRAVHQGVIVGAGQMARLNSSQYDGCRKLHGLRACYSASFYQEGLLDVAVFVPGRHRPTVVEIGLAGNGSVARTIFESIGPG